MSTEVTCRDAPVSPSSPPAALAESDLPRHLGRARQHSQSQVLPFWPLHQPLHRPCGSGHVLSPLREALPQTRSPERDALADLTLRPLPPRLVFLGEYFLTSLICSCGVTKALKLKSPAQIPRESDVTTPQSAGRPARPSPPLVPHSLAPSHPLLLSPGLFTLPQRPHLFCSQLVSHSHPVGDHQWAGDGGTGAPQCNVTSGISFENTEGPTPLGGFGCQQMHSVSAVCFAHRVLCMRQLGSSPTHLLPGSQEMQGDVDAGLRSVTSVSLFD